MCESVTNARPSRACARAIHDAETAELGYENGPFRSEWRVALDSYWASIPEE